MNRNKIFEFAIGPLGTAGIGLLLLPLMAWVFEPVDMGRLNLLNLTLSFTLLTMLMGLDIAFVREYHESKDQARLLKACLAPGLVLGIFASAAIIINFKDIFKIDNNKIILGSGILIVAIALNYISRFLSILLRMEEKGLAYSMSQILPKLIYLVLVIVIAISSIEKSFITILAIGTLSMAVTTAFLVWATRKKIYNALTSGYAIKDTGKLIKFGAPLTMSGLAFWGLTGTSSLVISKYSNLAELSIYALTTSVAAAATIFQSIFTIVWSPIIFKWIHEGTDLNKIDRLARQAVAAMSMILTIAGALSFIVEYILPSHYTDVKYLIVSAVIPNIFYTMSEITGMGITVSRKTNRELLITTIALIANILLNITLVPNYGAKGAVIANALAYFLYYIGRTEYSVRLWRNFPRMYIYMYFLVFGSASILTAFSRDLLGINHSIVWLAALPFVFYLFKKEYIDIYNFFRKN